MIALPGIIDAHTCLWQTLLRGYVPNLWTGAYYSALLPLRSRFMPEDNFTSAYVGGFEMLSYGTTTVVDYLHNIRGPGYAEASLAALKETGIRRLFTYSFMAVEPHQFTGPEDRFADGRLRLRPVPRSRRADRHRLRHRFDRRAGARNAACLRPRAQGALLHPRQRNRHHRPAECRAACSAPIFWSSTAT